MRRDTVPDLDVGDTDSGVPEPIACEQTRVFVHTRDGTTAYDLKDRPRLARGSRQLPLSSAKDQTRPCCIISVGLSISYEEAMKRLSEG